jgi:quinohemoprotein amine dehydrogenase
MRTILRTAAVLTLLACATGAKAFTRESLVWQKCAGCHAPSADGRLARVEEIRTTPEEWTVIVDRMRRLHGMPLTRSEMGRLLKELCATQILTPEEQAKVSYLSLFHNSQQLEAAANEQEQRLFATCVRCHSAGKIRSYRMTAGNWSKLRDFHLFMDPAVIYQMREMHWRDEADAVLKAVGETQGYGQAWRAPATSLEGQWLVVGREPGKGTYRGEAMITGGADGEYRIAGKLHYSDRTSEPFEGEATLYGGYALRTRTRHAGAETRGAYILSGSELKGQNHFPAPRFRTSSATWVRRDGGPRVVRVTPGFLLSGERTTVTLEGVGLPAVTAADVAFTGGAVKVLAARRTSPDAIALEVVASAPTVGAARLAVKGIDAGSVVLAPGIDYVVVTPGTGRARLAGGPAYPAEGVQFEAIAYARRIAAREDKQAVVPAALKDDPAADVVLGPVPAAFTLAEEKTREGDDDLRWAARIASNGSYIPKGNYSPQASRTYSNEGSGLVKVLATYRRGARTYKSEAQLAVTVPDFVQRIR